MVAILIIVVLKVLALILVFFFTFAAIACSSMTATSKGFSANAASGSTDVIYIKPSQPSYTSISVTTAVTSTVPLDILVGNASMPQSYNILYIGKRTKL